MSVKTILNLVGCVISQNMGLTEVAARYCGGNKAYWAFVASGKNRGNREIHIKAEQKYLIDMKNKYI